MKKIALLIFVASSIIFVSCDDGKAVKENPESVTPKGMVVDKVDALANADSDTTKLVCTCEHKCKTKEECEKSCGPKCDKLVK